MKTFTLFSFASVASAMCHYGTTLAPRSNMARRAESTWDYHGEQGPLEWHGVSSEYKACASGKNQSPVNVLSEKYDTKHGSDYNFKIDSYPDGAEFENTGHNVQVYVNGTTTIADEDYKLTQYHFHTPSEHHIDNEYYPMEVHFVFQAADESIAVVGFLIEVADQETTSDVMMASLTNVGEIRNPDDTTTTEALDFSDLESHISLSEVYSYAGSLTTPPCDEGVNFNVVADPVYVDVATWRYVKDVVKFNSRYTQNDAGLDNLITEASDSL